jgi:hypothetical protein
LSRKTQQSAFVVKILSQENATWQGTVTWVETNETQPFRSVLELIKMIDSTGASA